MNTDDPNTPRTKPIRLSVAPPLDQPRNVQDEREITALPFEGAMPWALVNMAEARAPEEPVKDVTGRDFCQETLEELADARNYLVWEIQKLEERGPVAGTSPARARLDQALRSVALSFGLVQRAQREIAEELAA